MDGLRRYQLNALRAVEAVGRLGSLAKAAAELGVTAGAVSQQVHNCERRLGRPLFHRSPKGLEPTAQAETLLAGLSRGFDEIARSLAQMEARHDDILTVTVAPVLASKWLVPRLKRFHDAHPDLRLRIDASVELADFASSDIDAGVRVGKGPWPGVRADHLADQRLFPVCSPALASAVQGIDDLRRLPVIRDHGSPAMWDVWLAAHGRAGMELGRGPIFSDAALCLDAAVAGQGIMLAWPVLASYALKAGQVISPIPQPVPSGLAYWLVSSARWPRPAKAKAFERWLRDEFAADRVG